MSVVNAYFASTEQAERFVALLPPALHASPVRERSPAPLRPVTVQVAVPHDLSIGAEPLPHARGLLGRLIWLLSGELDAEIPAHVESWDQTHDADPAAMLDFGGDLSHLAW